MFFIFYNFLGHKMVNTEIAEREKRHYGEKIQSHGFCY